MDGQEGVSGRGADGRGAPRSTPRGAPRGARRSPGLAAGARTRGGRKGSRRAYGDPARARRVVGVPVEQRLAADGDAAGKGHCRPEVPLAPAPAVQALDARAPAESASRLGDRRVGPDRVQHPLGPLPALGPPHARSPGLPAARRVRCCGPSSAGASTRGAGPDDEPLSRKPTSTGQASRRCTPAAAPTQVDADAPHPARADHRPTARFRGDCRDDASAAWGRRRSAADG